LNLLLLRKFVVINQLGEDRTTEGITDKTKEIIEEVMIVITIMIVITVENDPNKREETKEDLKAIMKKVLKTNSPKEDKTIKGIKETKEIEGITNEKDRKALNPEVVLPQIENKTSNRIIKGTDKTDSEPIRTEEIIEVVQVHLRNSHKEEDKPRESKEIKEGKDLTLHLVQGSHRRSKNSKIGIRRIKGISRIRGIKGIREIRDRKGIRSKKGEDQVLKVEVLLQI